MDKKYRSKYKVLFDVRGDKNWIGGVYYLKNIVYGIVNTEEVSDILEPIIVCHEDFYDLFVEFSDKCKIYKYNNKFQKKIILSYATIKSDIIYNYHRYKYDYFRYLDKKALYWIPDLQECHYSQFFSKSELYHRSLHNHEVARSGHPVVLSSRNSLNDFHSFFGCDLNRTYVIPFVSAIEKEVRDLSEEYCKNVLKKYSLVNQKFVIISNQFWQHKNHIVVFRAVLKAVEKRALEDVVFVFTGELKDYRNSEYYNDLLNITKKEAIAKRIRILGFIDRKEQLALMHKSVLIIQPSLFEGWGTVVEDAKVLDKLILLSRIPIHEEQMNDNCILFDPMDSQDLFNKLLLALNMAHIDDVEKGIGDMKKRANEYTSVFIKIVSDLRGSGIL